MPQLTRNTSVVSISLDPKTIKDLDTFCQISNRSRSAAISEMIRKYLWRQKWEQMREWGRQTAKKLNITSEEDVYKLLGDA